MKKLLLILATASLAAALAACGNANTATSAGSTGSAPAAPSGSAGSAASSSDPYGGDFGYSGLLTALAEQGKIKVKAKYSTTKYDGSTGSNSMEVIGKFYEVTLGDVQREGTNVIADFTAVVKNDSQYIEEPLHIIATLQSDGAGNYTFTSARIQGDLPIAVKPVVPFSVDLLYESGFVLAYACSSETLEAQRDRILFNDSITAEKETVNKFIDYEILVPMTRENIKSIELLPYSKEDKVIKGSDFEIWADFKITLQNDVVVYRAENMKLYGTEWRFGSNARGFRAVSERIENL